MPTIGKNSPNELKKLPLFNGNDSLYDGLNIDSNTISIEEINNSLLNSNINSSNTYADEIIKNNTETFLSIIESVYKRVLRNDSFQYTKIEEKPTRINSSYNIPPISGKITKIYQYFFDRDYISQ